MMLIQHSVNSDWLFNDQSIVLQADWFIKEINEKATSKLTCPIEMIIPSCVRHTNSLFILDATGTGILFFDFYRILMTLMGRQEDPVLWLFENVVHMNKETKETICRFLEVITLCAVCFYVYHDTDLDYRSFAGSGRRCFDSIFFKKLIMIRCFDLILLEKLIMIGVVSFSLLSCQR